MKYIKLLLILFFLFLSSVSTTHALNLFSFPDPTLTPGKSLSVTTIQICKKGYTKTVRDVSTSTKKQIFKEYGISYSNHANYEVDHFIPLELGGSNDIKNLWPEPGTIPNPKDKVEDYLHTQVCANKLSLQKAQSEIVTNWYTVYLSITSTKTLTIKPIPTKAIVIVPPETSTIQSVSNTTQTTQATSISNQNCSQDTALCNDGTCSDAAHHQGACSHHGGVNIFYR